MFHVSRDSNCFQPDDVVDDNPRTAGVVELIEFLVYPGAGLLLIFLVLILNNYVNTEKQSSIGKRFHTSSRLRWHMHGDMLQALDRLRKAEKNKNLEFAELGADGNPAVRRAMKAKKEAEIEIKMMEKEKLAQTIKYFKFQEGVEIQIGDKWAFRKLRFEAEEDVKKLDRDIRKIEKKYATTRRHKFEGIFSKKDGGNVFWSPADVVLYHLKHRKLDKKRMKFHEVMVHSLDEIYG